MHKTLTDIAVAEALLRSGGIIFRSLEPVELGSTFAPFRVT
jgi:hypothetical protein